MGEAKIDGIDGSDKEYQKQKMWMIGTEESNNESMTMSSYSMICDKEKEFKFKFYWIMLQAVFKRKYSNRCKRWIRAQKNKRCFQIE